MIRHMEKAVPDTVGMTHRSCCCEHGFRTIYRELTVSQLRAGCQGDIGAEHPSVPSRNSQSNTPTM